MTIDCDKEYFQQKSGLWKGYKLYDLYKYAATPWDWQPKIQAECKRLGLDFLSTPFDASAVDFLESLGVEAYKIASFELVDIPLIRYTAQKGKPMIVSTGMGTMEEIQDAVDAMLGEGLSKEQITLLLCTSAYPALSADANLATLADMQKRFSVRVGLSDHSMSPYLPVTAVVLGACVIEKHFCLSRSLKSADSAFSLEPQEFKEMAQACRETAEALGHVAYGPTEHEKNSIVFRRSIFAVQDIAEGEPFTTENIRVIRPGQGLAPQYFSTLLGKPSHKSYERGEPIGKEALT
jgi:pseudaminic acid synthase